MATGFSVVPAAQTRIVEGCPLPGNQWRNSANRRRTKMQPEHAHVPASRGDIDRSALACRRRIRGSRKNSSMGAGGQIKRFGDDDTAVLASERHGYRDGIF